MVISYVLLKVRLVVRSSAQSNDIEEKIECQTRVDLGRVINRWTISLSNRHWSLRLKMMMRSLTAVG
jgi:hypothetical protein